MTAMLNRPEELRKKEQDLVWTGCKNRRKRVIDKSYSGWSGAGCRSEGIYLAFQWHNSFIHLFDMEIKP
jgi:hypothetical protein